ncbi:hypothetical protein [Bacteroides sp.]|uniref:hypothetical protein n=1 Tax=Bacteroides sp. TaxID=29523 RepID=UPI0023D31034|nr:hypothetical protein [Bacteroides sp.]MDE5761039.1 hypothetical protein [Bacteroides sp.]MDE6214905.1 hypothetical protein [Bacteroides sp.]MDE6492245.1 hypothetical protein [Lactobacillus sp.]
MKKTNEFATMQEMSVQEMNEVNGGSLLVWAVLAVGSITISMCSNNHVSTGQGTGNNVAIGDSIQNK